MQPFGRRPAIDRRPARLTAQRSSHIVRLPEKGRFNFLGTPVKIATRQRLAGVRSQVVPLNTSQEQLTAKIVHRISSGIG
jgi:hypothetical protein